MKKNAISMNGEVDESVKGDDDHGHETSLSPEWEGHYLVRFPNGKLVGEPD